MDFIFSTGSLWPYSLARCFAFAAAAGFDGIELMVDQRWDTRQPNYLRGLMDQYGLPILAVHSPFMAAPGWPVPKPERIQCAAALAEAVGARVVVHHLPALVGRVFVQTDTRFFPLPIPFWNQEKGYRHWLETEYPLLKAQTSVQLCIENMPAFRRWGRPWNWAAWNTPQAIRRFPDITLDTTHLGTWDIDPIEVYPLLKNHIGHVHLSNYDGREHRRPEDGRLRLDQFVTQLAADGYPGAISLELHPDALDAGQGDDHVVARMAASLAHCRTWANGAGKGE